MWPWPRTPSSECVSAGRLGRHLPLHHSTASSAYIPELNASAAPPTCALQRTLKTTSCHKALAMPHSHQEHITAAHHELLLDVRVLICQRRESVLHCCQWRLLTIGLHLCIMMATHAVQQRLHAAPFKVHMRSVMHPAASRLVDQASTFTTSLCSSGCGIW